MFDNEIFDAKPKVKSKKLNVLPNNPETSDCSKAVGVGRFPSWLHRKMPKGFGLGETGHILGEKRLHTVCEEAKCPNLVECWSKKTATFLILGKECTRACGFCDIDFSKHPKTPDVDEPRHVAQSVKELGLKHVVITMVARDDLSDGGAHHLVSVVKEIKEMVENVTIELLTSDFNGNPDSWDIVLNSRPDIFNYNIETVRELTSKVRHTATYERTLSFLKYIKKNVKDSHLLTKSGIMVGLGETEDQVMRTINDLKEVEVDIITIGQYLQPNKNKLRVKEFITPQQFKYYEEYGYSLGIKHMYCGPFVRSSYNANLFNKERDND